MGGICNSRSYSRKNFMASQWVDKMAKWCNNFVIIPKPNGTVHLCLDPERRNQALIRPMHRGPTLNDILPKVNNVHNMTIINSSSDYHNLKLDKKSSYLIMFACQFGQGQIHQTTIWSGVSR